MEAAEDITLQDLVAKSRAIGVIQGEIKVRNQVIVAITAYQDIATSGMLSASDAFKIVLDALLVPEESE